MHDKDTLGDQYARQNTLVGVSVVHNMMIHFHSQIYIFDTTNVIYLVRVEMPISKHVVFSRQGNVEYLVIMLATIKKMHISPDKLGGKKFARIHAPIQ
jgi:hypothetical protein